MGPSGPDSNRGQRRVNLAERLPPHGRFRPDWRQRDVQADHVGIKHIHLGHGQPLLLRSLGLHGELEAISTGVQALDAVVVPAWPEGTYPRRAMPR